MKNSIFRSALGLTLALVMGTGLTACKDALNIEPLTGVDASTALDSETKVGSAVVGIYAKLDHAGLYGTNLLLLPELMGSPNYITWQGTFQSYRDVARRTNLNSLNTEAERTWRRAYEAINQANLVIGALPVVQTAALKSRYEGEALFIRGALYFELVRLYGAQFEPGSANSGPAVPISLTAVDNLEEAGVKATRSTVAEVYTQVINDLTAAYAKLPKDNGTYATKYTAQALLARVYLQQGNYPAAGTAANDVILNSGKNLAGTLEAVFANRNSSETLFEIQQNDQNNAGTANDGLATFYASYKENGGNTGRGDVSITGDFAKLYDASDARGTDSLSAQATRKLIYLGNGARPGALRTIKWRRFGQNIPVIRLAEMYLIRAEADVRAGTTATALADVNRIRSRSGASVLTSVTLAEVLRERQLELAFEGFRIYDLKRTNAILVPARMATMTEPEAPAVPANSNKLTLPVPQREINVNSLLTQNPGY